LALPVSPQLSRPTSQPCASRPRFFPAACGFPSPIYFFFFFAAFLAFLFFAITSLHQKLKKQSTAPVQSQRAIQPTGRARRRILFVARWRRATWKIYFPAKKLVLFAKFESLS
jgi:hypothetical protein